MKKIYYFAICTLLFFSEKSFAQKNNWTLKEKSMYKTAKAFATELSKGYDSMKRKSFIDKYLVGYFEKDGKKLENFPMLDTLLIMASDFVKENKVENIDARPLRFYNKEQQKKFDDNGMVKLKPYIFVYYLKSKPNELAYMLFDDKTKKIKSWILLNIGDYSFM